MRRHHIGIVHGHRARRISARGRSLGRARWYITVRLRSIGLRRWSGSYWLLPMIGRLLMDAGSAIAWLRLVRLGRCWLGVFHLRRWLRCGIRSAMDARACRHAAIGRCHSLRLRIRHRMCMHCLLNVLLLRMSGRMWIALRRGMLRRRSMIAGRLILRLLGPCCLVVGTRRL